LDGTSLSPTTTTFSCSRGVWLLIDVEMALGVVCLLLKIVACRFYWRFERALSPHFFVSLVFRDKMNIAMGLEEVKQNVSVECTHLAPMNDSATTFSASLHDLTVSHLQKLPLKDKVWMSAAVKFKYAADRLKICRLSASLRYQSEHNNKLKNGVFVFKGYADVDSTNETKRLGRLSLSYVHRVDRDWFVGAGVKADVGSRKRGVTLRDADSIAFGGLKSPEIKVGTWYRWADPELIVRLRAKAYNNFKDLDMRGSIEKTFPEYSLTPFLQLAFNPLRTGSFTVSLGINFGGMY